MNTRQKSTLHTADNLFREARRLALAGDLAGAERLRDQADSLYAAVDSELAGKAARAVRPAAGAGAGNQPDMFAGSVGR